MYTDRIRTVYGSVSEALSLLLKARVGLNTPSQPLEEEAIRVMEGLIQELLTRQVSPTGISRALGGLAFLALSGFPGAFPSRAWASRTSAEARTMVWRA